MSKLKITQGRDFGVEETKTTLWIGTLKGEGVMRKCDDIVTYMDIDGLRADVKARYRANANLIAETFNVSNETGKTPRELMEQRDALRGMLQRAVNRQGFTDAELIETRAFIASLTSPK